MRVCVSFPFSSDLGYRCAYSAPNVYFRLQPQTLGANMRSDNRDPHRCWCIVCVCVCALFCVWGRWCILFLVVRANMLLSGLRALGCARQLHPGCSDHSGPLRIVTYCLPCKRQTSPTGLLRRGACAGKGGCAHRFAWANVTAVTCTTATELGTVIYIVEADTWLHYLFLNFLLLCYDLPLASACFNLR